jgi:hypothetical protein
MLGSSSLERDCLPDHRVLVGSHHKTGTVWLFNIFSEIAPRAGCVISPGR